jgi:hypothetical protein
MEHPARVDPPADDAARCDGYTSSGEEENRPAPTTDDRVAGKRPMAVEPSLAEAEPAGAAADLMMGLGLTSCSRAPKHRRLIRIVDDDDDEEEAASTLVRRPRSHPDIAPGDGARVAEDPPAAHVDQARPGGTETMAAAGRARRRIFSAAHQSLNL